MQLGWGDVNLCEKFPFKPRKRKAHPNVLEYCLVEEEKWNPIVGPLVPTDIFAWVARKHNYIHVVPSRKGAMLVDVGVANVVFSVFHGGQA